MPTSLKKVSVVADLQSEAVDGTEGCKSKHESGSDDYPFAFARFLVFQGFYGFRVLGFNGVNGFVVISLC